MDTNLEQPNKTTESNKIFLKILDKLPHLNFEHHDAPCELIMFIMNIFTPKQLKWEFNKDGELTASTKNFTFTLLEDWSDGSYELTIFIDYDLFNYVSDMEIQFDGDIDGAKQYCQKYCDELFYNLI